jgi:hypothetical protein
MTAMQNIRLAGIRQGMKAILQPAGGGVPTVAAERRVRL